MLKSPWSCALIAAALILSGCGRASIDRETVRPGEAVLSLAQVERARSSGFDLQGLSANAVSAEQCESVAQGVKQVSDATGGALRFDGNGVIIVSREVWDGTPAELRESLGQVAALQGACAKKLALADVVVTFRAPSGEVFAKGRLRDLSR